jgi:NADPH:quinone reductase-like Zn-dependent oxidoreductase
MRAMIIRQPANLDHIEAVERPRPENPGVGEILVRLKASSLNFHDYAVATGLARAEDGRILLCDGAGEVVATGRNVTDFARGDSVVSTFFPGWIDGRPLPTGNPQVPGDHFDGYACDYVLASASAFTKAPRGYSAAEAATLPCAGLTAWRALVVEGRLSAGQTVLVQGTGGVSIFALQFAKAMGATVIATSSSDEKLDRAKALGADHLINYKSTPDWGALANQLTGGVDHIVEVGGAGTLAQSIEAVAHGGHISLIGLLAGFAGPVVTAMLMAKQVRLQGIMVGSRRQQQDMIAAIEATGIRPVISHRFELENLAVALRHEEQHLHFGKIAIEIAD